MTIGGMSRTYDENEIFGHQVTGSLHWELLLLSVSLGSEKSNSFTPVNRALTDTGTENLGMPRADYLKFKDNVCSYLET